MDIEWRIDGDIDGDARDYLESPYVSFSAEAAHRVLKAGPKLVAKYEDVRLYARHVQGIHMRAMAPQARNARNPLGEAPELGEQISGLRDVGALPNYGGSSPGAVRSSGLPYDESKIYLAARKLWKDVRKGGVLVLHGDAINTENPMAHTPSTKAVRNIPDREISPDVGIISDL